jgi:dipeptidyl aminopeptidase/acylaminoacyl peptidase
VTEPSPFNVSTAFIRIANLDGSAQRFLDFGGNSFDPAWLPALAAPPTPTLTPTPTLSFSPIVFASKRDGHYELYGIDTDGGTLTRLTQISGNITGGVAPAWSPDGKQLTFKSDRDGNLEIYTMNSDGSGERRLTDDTASELFPSWSPDGKQIQ